MAAGAILTIGLGAFGSASRLITLGYLPGAPAPVPDTTAADTHDGGAYQTVKVKRKPWKRKDGDVRKWLLDAYRDATEEPAAAAVVAEIIAPFVKAEASTVPTVPKIDWRAFARDVAAVQSLLAVLEQLEIERQRDEEEGETMLMLMGF